MSEEALRALRRDRLVDITTKGRKTGRTRRIEITFSILSGKLYLTGRPGRRGWYANLLADPNFTFHLKQSVRVDLPATARPVRDPEERRRLLTEHRAKQPRFAPRIDLEEWIAHSPLVEVTIPGVTDKLGSTE